MEILLESKEATINKSLEISASDNDDYSITQLRQVNPEINWQRYNFMDGFNAPVSLAIRLECELDTQQWREVFKKSQAKRIFMLCEVFKPIDLIHRTIQTAFKPRSQFAGYIRTETGIHNLFATSPFFLSNTTHVLENLYLFDLLRR